MEKKFTLMKTLTAFRNLLFGRSKKNCRTVTNDQTPVVGCGTNTTVDSHLKYSNDPGKSGSFLFFEQANSQESGVDIPQSIKNEKNKEESKKANDELAQKSIPNPVYKNWRERVNDDLAACSPVISRESVVVSRESITVLGLLKNIFPTTTIHNETRTKKNDAFLPFASFSFLSKIISAALRSFQQDDRSKILKPVFIPVRSMTNQKCVLKIDSIKKNQI